MKNVLIFGVSFLFGLILGSIVEVSANGAWIPQESGASVISFRDVHFVDTSNGWVVGYGFGIGQDGIWHNRGEIWHTRDGGETWELQFSTEPDPNLWVTSIFFLDMETGWATGIHGRVFRTTNGGEMWEQDTIAAWQYHLSDIYFVDHSNGWVVGGWSAESPEPEGTGAGRIILHTSNSGEDWEIQLEEGGPWPNDLPPLVKTIFSDPDTGWALSLKHRIFSTCDGGDVWITHGLPSSDFLSDVTFKNNSKGWVVGHNGAILYTSNGGLHWEAQESHTDNILFDIDMLDSGEGWIVGDHGTILHTTDNGHAWEIQSTGTDAMLSDVSFVDAEHGWAVGFGAIILHYSKKSYIEMSSLTATGGFRRVILEWSIQIEANNSGWDVFRSEIQDSGFIKVNDMIVPGTGTSYEPYTYSYIDTTVANGATYYYYLEQIGTDSSRTKTSIVSATAGLKGDVNEDGEINVIDVIRVVDIMLGFPPAPTQYELWAADFNCDGEINVLDAVLIIKEILCE